VICSLAGELSATAAVVGGVLAGEIIKAVSVCIYMSHHHSFDC
jgi:cytoskeletal protein CcmA (bactofilin family)